MKCGIIGVGAVGGYYGGLLAKNGFDIHFLLHSDYLYVKKNGLFIESKDGDYHLSDVNAYSKAEDMPLCDLVIVALKTTENYQLPTMLPHIIKDNGIILILQNGLGVEKEIADMVPKASILGGLCFLCSNKVGPGHIKHLDYGSVIIGEYLHEYRPSGINGNMKLIADLFKNAGISVQLTENLGLARWKKLVWNIPFNGLSVILDATTDQLMAHPSTRCLAENVMREVITGAKHCGFFIEKEYADDMLKLTEQMTAYKPSMKLDFEAGRQMEIEKIYSQPIYESASAGYDMVSTRVICLQLEYLDIKAAFDRSDSH